MDLQLWRVRPDKISVKILLQFLILILFLVGCSGKGPSLPEAASKPADPVLEMISYTQYGGTPIDLSPPFGYLKLTPDYGNGSCDVTKTEFTLKGTYDPETAISLLLTGAVAPTVNLSASHFEIIFCATGGATSLKLTALNAEQTANKNAVVFSLNLNKLYQLNTIGTGSPRYPSTGFQIASGASAAKVTTSTLLKLTSVNVSENKNQLIQSTGNTGLTMATGSAATIRRQEAQ